MDTVDNKAAANEIVMIKVVVANLRATASTMRMAAAVFAMVWRRAMLGNARCGLADGPDEVHRAAIAKNRLRRYI